MIIARHAQTRWPLRSHLGHGQQIAEWPQHFLDLPVVLFDDLRIDANAGHLQKEMTVGARLIDELDLSRANHFPRRDEIERNAQLHGKDVHRAHRQNAERDRRVADAVDNLINRAVAAGRHDGGEPLLHRALRLCFGIAGAAGGADDDVAREPVQPGEPRLRPTRGRVHDDANTIQGWLGMKGCGTVKAMRKIMIAFAVIVVGVVLAIAAGAFYLNTYIHSTAFKTEVQARASQSIGGPVTMQDVDFNIFQGVKLKSFTTQLDPGHDGGQGALKVQIASVNCGYSWIDLFQGKLTLTAVTLDQPHVVLTKQATAPPPAQALPGGLDSGTTAGPGTAMGFHMTLNCAKVSDGTLSILNADGVSMIELKGVDASANTSGFFSGEDVTGTIRIADAQASNLHVTKFYIPFTWHQNFLDAKSFEATAFNGDLAGDYHLEGSAPSVLNLNAKGLDVAQVTAATASSSSARLSGTLAFQSKWRGVEDG